MDVIHPRASVSLSFKTYNAMFSEKTMQEVLKRLNPIQLTKYSDTRKLLLKCKVDQDPEYQKNIFQNFYCMETFDQKYLEIFFSILEREKRNAAIHFGSILEEIVHNVEIHNIDIRQRPLCFLCSVLVHTVNPNLPIWDNTALEHFNLDKPFFRDEIDSYDKIYSEFKTKLNEKIKNNEFKKWIYLFDRHFKDAEEFINFTDIKKIDLFFWKYRPNINAKPFSLDESIMNHARVGKALLMLRQGFLPYVKHEYLNENEEVNRKFDEYYQNYYSKIPYYHRNQYVTEWDIISLYYLLNDDLKRKIQQYRAKMSNIRKQHKIFSNNFEKLHEHRNNWAHQQFFDTEEVCQVFDLALNLLKIISETLKVMSATQQADKIDRVMKDLRLDAEQVCSLNRPPTDS